MKDLFRLVLILPIEMDSDTIIRAIDEKSVKKICSGQVIVSTVCAVKELIENSLDAGATNIIINFKDHGKEISVSDNGHGISKQDYPNLCKKHHTSKISSDFDLNSLQTLGFRGEALSSLCELSNLTMITRTSDDSVGTILEFNDSSVPTTKPHAREVGTTVIVKDLFRNLPVRQSELTKHLKREYAKCVSLIQEYAIINQVRFIVQLNVNGKVQNVFSSKGLGIEQSMKEILGKEVCDTLVNFEMNDVLTMSGWITKPDVTSKNDFEYVFINRRPVDLKFKILSNCIKNLEGKKPSFVLDFRLATDTFDINVTPNKRKIILKESDLENVLLEYLLKNVWKKLGEYDDSGDDFELTDEILDQYDSKTPIRNSMVKKTDVDSDPCDCENSDDEFAKSILNQESEEEEIEVPKKSHVPVEIIGVNTKKDNDLLKPMTPKITPQKRTNQVLSSSSEDDISEDESIEEIESIKFENEVNMSVAKRSPVQMVKQLFPEDSNIEIEVELDDILSQYDSISRKSHEDTINFSKKDISDEKSSINELDRRIHKNDFGKMTVIGQYNHSFIICHLNNDLYILDQHACDEKYNYETMFSEKMNTQPLILPKRLDISDDDFELIMKREKLFEQYGFKFDDSFKCLKTVPFSRNTVFNENDVLEMLFLLKNNPDLPCRPSKIQKMFASRACRKSVMFGDALSDKEMKRIVQHLTQLQHPWCCPHGRPTMRFIGSIEND
jgi:DNA mismatch repair protein PMS2